MFAVDQVILVAGVLLVIGIVSSKLLERAGVPVLLLFLVVGMLAGSEGPGGIEFENYALAHGLGTLALCLILFDGGLGTDVTAMRRVVWPALTLATVGVLVTAVATAAVAALVLDLGVLEALLLGSIVSSTDAAAVFTAFRNQGMHVRERLALTLEAESGANDPMAVFLTVACVEMLLGRMEPGIGALGLFAQQMVLGAAIGGLVGWVAAEGIRRIELVSTGLYPALTGSSALLAYGAAASVGGSGFLAVYIAGLVIGSRRLPLRRGVRLFHDGLAWLAQMAMFMLLGLLIFPSRLLGVSVPALGIAAGLLFLARPIALALCLLPFRFRAKELVFFNWGGLKGAVPIVLAIYPLLAGLQGYAVLFDVVFFVVLASAITQGWSLPLMAKLLGVSEPPKPQTGVTLEIESLRDVEGDIVEYVCHEETRAAGRRVRELALPQGVVIAMLVRDNKVVPPSGSTQILPGDHLFVLLRPDVRDMVDRVFKPEYREADLRASTLEFPLRGTTRVSELERFYDIQIDAPGDKTLADLLVDDSGEILKPGEQLSFGPAVLRVRDVIDGRIESVALSFRE